MKLTDEQLDAAIEASESNPDLRGLSESDVAWKLKEQGHPLFATFGDVPAVKPGPNTALAQTLPADVPVDAGPPPGAEGSLVVAERTAVAVVEQPGDAPIVRFDLEGGDGLEEIDGEDITLMRLALSQDQSKDEGKQVESGKWWLHGDVAGANKVRQVVLLHVGKQRSLMLPLSGRDAVDAVKRRIKEENGVDVPEKVDGAVCSSPDRIRPEHLPERTWAPDGLAHDCKSCPRAQWRGRGVPPDCGEAYRVLAVDITDGGWAPCVFYLHGSAIKHTKQFLTIAKCTTKRDGRPLWAYHLALSSREEQSKDPAQGAYYVPTFSKLVPISDESKLAEFTGLRAALLSLGRDAEPKTSEAA